MSVQVIGLDHLYLAVRDLTRSEAFYDPVMTLLGFRKTAEPLGGEPHLFYYNRDLTVALRPAKGGVDHDRFAPGLHHLCLRVEDHTAVDQAHAGLCALGVEATEPQLYREYAPDYYATFFSDPDAIRLEITNFREERRRRAREWEAS
jgi:glyoxylase I family protein